MIDLASNLTFGPLYLEDQNIFRPNSKKNDEPLQDSPKITKNEEKRWVPLAAGDDAIRIQRMLCLRGMILMVESSI